MVVRELETKMKSGLFENQATPLHLIDTDIYAKLECCQRTGSVKDRFVFETVKKAVIEDEISTSSTLVEATSGNTGISLAAAGAALGLPVKIVMPVNMSEERKQMMRRFGAEVIEVGPSDFQEAIQKRNDLVRSNENYWSPMQFENPYNVEVHRAVTGPEIEAQLRKRGVDSWDFVSGAGTGGTLMGLHHFFLEGAQLQDARDRRVIQVCPHEDAKSHGIQGINDGQDFLLDKSLMYETISVKTEDAKKAARAFAKEHGILIGISAGANIVAAKEYKIRNKSRKVVTLLCDRGERYFSSL